MNQSGYIEIIIPSLPPGINQTYQRTHKGGIALTPSARRWDKDAALIVGATAGRVEFEPDLAANYQIVIRWWGGRHDADAHLKLIQDCVTRKLGFDDRQIKSCVIERCPGGWLPESKGVQICLFKALKKDWVSQLIRESKKENNND